MSLRHFAIASPNYLNALLLPQLTADLLALAPNIRLNVLTALHNEDLLGALADGRTDLLIANWRQVSGHLKTAPLLEDRPVCVMARNHPYAALDRLSLPEYLTLDHISPTSRADARYSPIDEQLGRLGAKRRITMVMPDYMMLPLVVARTRHVLTTGARFGAFAARMASVKVVDAPPELNPIRFRMLWHERSHSDPAHQWLRGVIRATAKSTFDHTEDALAERSAVAGSGDALAPQHLGEDDEHRR
jgi:DNA-binding transcriptional LysR family regulator